MKQALLAFLLAGAVLAQTAPKSTGSPSSTSKAPVAPAPPAADLLHPSTLKLTAPASFRAKLATTKGDIVIEVTRAWAPRGADRFYNLVRAGYFTDAPFYRVMPHFMAQFGISARPEVNRAFEGADILDDPRNTQSNTRGKVTFATTGQPNSRGTALFINLVDENKFLDTQGFVPIGEVVEGMANADLLYNGYGDTSVKQQLFENGGKSYVDKTYPKLDRISTATIAPAAPPAGPGASNGSSNGTSGTTGTKGTAAPKATTAPKT
jgi:peptidyl-prolyl cis-trans isomerase A (cyclophilin A)